jgi:hypothetical protein
MIYALIAILAIAIATLTSLFFNPPRKLAQVLITISTVVALVGLVGLPALAASNTVPSALNSGDQLLQKQPFKFEENINISADQCSGLCIAQEQTDFQDDSDLLQAIIAKVPDEQSLDIKVDNSSVFLTGAVNDEATARDLIKQVETIPGVHWITIELALTHQAQPVAG